MARGVKYNDDVHGKRHAKRQGCPWHLHPVLRRQSAGRSSAMIWRTTGIAVPGVMPGSRRGS